jgi:hypothetical protein
MSFSWYELMWIPGTLLGVSIGCLGAFVGVQASRGKLRPSALRSMLAMTAVSAVFLLTGIATLAAGQPRWIWYGFLLPGLIGVVGLGCNLPSVMKRVREQSP